MKKSTKVTITVIGVLALLFGGVGVYAATRPKNEKPEDNDTEPDPTSTEPDPIGTSTEPDPTSTEPDPTGTSTEYTPGRTEDPTGTEPDPTGTSTEYTPGRTEDPLTPTPSDYIRMADRWMTWDNTWKFAEKLGISDKDAVGGGANAYTNAIITNDSRMLFDQEIKAKFPNWKTLLKRKAAKFGIPVLSTSAFKENTDYINDQYGMNLSYFNGNAQKISNFWGM